MEMARLKEITDYLTQVKHVELKHNDVQYFETVLRLATNDGYKSATEVAKPAKVEAYKYQIARDIREEMDETTGVMVTVLRRKLEELLDLLERESKRE